MLVALLAVLGLLLSTVPAAACPFCTALAPTLSQRAEQAEVVALGEVESVSPDDRTCRVRIHDMRKGNQSLNKSQSISAQLDLSVRPGDLVLLFGRAADDADAGHIEWHAVRVDEASYAYFARSPSLERPPRERLEYFARYLEQPSALVAEDAYLEFGHAPFSAVADASGALPFQKMKNWLVDTRVPESRKGFYGLAVALAAPQQQQAETERFLRRLIESPANDFRAGFDGILGGYLLLAGEPGLELIESRYLANPHSADGDVRHALTALRFYQEYGRSIPRERLDAAVAHLLTRPEFAEAAITDLARSGAWTFLDRVVDVYGQETSDTRTRRAVVGYLLACQDERAVAALAELRAADPKGVSAAEEVLSRTSSLGTGQ